MKKETKDKVVERLTNAKIKILINGCYGGFGLSDEACEWLIKNKKWKVTEYAKGGKGYKDKKAKLVKTNDKLYGKYWVLKDNDDVRIDKDVIECVETIGSKKASSGHAKLRVIEIPSDVEWEIDEYDGIEHVAEKHRTWR